MAAISLFWDTNMAAVTSCENTLLSKIIRLKNIYIATLCCEISFAKKGQDFVSCSVYSTSFPESLFFPPQREIERETLVGASHVTAHDKLLPSRGTLAQLFYLQEPIRDFQAGAI